MQNGQNPSSIAQIQAKWPQSDQKLGIGGLIAWIWAIWQKLGQNRPQRRALRMGRGEWMGICTYRQMYGQTDSLCVLQDFVPFGAAAQNMNIRASVHLFTIGFGRAT